MFGRLSFLLPLSLLVLIIDKRLGPDILARPARSCQNVGGHVVGYRPDCRNASAAAPATGEPAVALGLCFGARFTAGIDQGLLDLACELEVEGVFRDTPRAHCAGYIGRIDQRQCLFFGCRLDLRSMKPFAQRFGIISGRQF